MTPEQEPLWLNKAQMREVGRIVNPRMTLREFNIIWARTMLERRTGSEIRVIDGDA